MTFNIRYDNPDDNLNNWKYRKEEVVKLILLKIDILAGGISKPIEGYVQKITRIYIGVGREDGIDKGEALFFYKKDNLTLLKSG
jgi:hypothetical protein